MELTNAQIALQSAVALTRVTDYVSVYNVTGMADTFLSWLESNTPQERIQDAR